MMVDFMMGHQIEGSKANYFIADPSELKEQYKKYVPYLTIEKALDISVNPDYIALINENKELRGQNETVSV
jgi:hypothetical protein